MSTVMGSNARPLASARRSSSAIAPALPASSRSVPRRRRSPAAPSPETPAASGRTAMTSSPFGNDRAPELRGAAAAPARREPRRTDAARIEDSAGRRSRDRRSRPRFALPRRHGGGGRRRDAPPVDLVAEPREQGGKHGHRAEHRDGTTRIVASEATRRSSRPEEHAGHRDHHGQARDEHRASRGGGGDLERSLRAPARCPLLPLALQVEHRVVDPDRETDQEHHRRCLHRDRQQHARERDEPEGREDGGQREQQRNARRHERAEREHENDQRD